MKDDYKDTFIYALRQGEYQILDGDNVKCMLDIGEGEFRWRNVRIAGVDAPETRLLAQRKVGEMVKTIVTQWLYFHKDNETLRMRVHSIKWDKYAGRIIGEIYFITPEGDKLPSLNHFLLQHELVKPYGGEKKPAWTEEQLDDIAARCKALLVDGGEALRPQL
jgi:hypothetical protein